VTLLEIGEFKIALEIRHFKNEGRVSFRKDFWNCCWRRAIELSGTLRSNDATATRTSLKKWIYVLSVFIATIPTHLLCQMYVNPPEVEFLGTLSEREIKLRCLFTYSIKCEIRHFDVVFVQKRQRNVQTTVMYGESYGFAYKTYCFYFWRSCCCPRRWIGQFLLNFPQ